MVSVMELVSAGIGAFGLEALGFTAQVRSHRSPIALLLDHSLRPRQGVQVQDLKAVFDNGGFGTPLPYIPQLSEGVLRNYHCLKGP